MLLSSPSCRMRPPIVPNLSGRPTGTAFSPRCSRLNNIATRSTRSMPSTSRWRACARWRARRCLAKSACNGGATSCAASGAGRRAPIRSRPRLLATIERHQLAVSGLIDLIDARRFDLYDEPMAGLADLEAYARKTSSGLFALAVQVLAGVGAEAVAEPAGIAYAIAASCAPFRSMPRGASSTCRSNCLSVTRCKRRTYSRADPRLALMRRSRNCETSRAAIWPRCVSA